MIKKEFIQMSRDKVTLGIMVLIPFLQVIIFGFAINMDVKHLGAAVFDQSLSKESREFLSALTATEYFDIKYAAGSLREVEEKIKEGKVKAGIVIPPDYAAGLKNNRGASIQLIVDASDASSATSAISAAQLVGERQSREILIGRLAATGRFSALSHNALDIRIRPWYNPDFITAFYMVPGLCSTILTITLLFLTSQAIIRERESGTLEQLIVTPLTALELMLGKLIPYMAVGYAQLTVLLLAARFVFNIPFRGSVFLLYVLTSLFIVASLAMGLLVSNLAKTQIQGMLVSFSLILPSIMLSGFIFPREAMPDIFYYLGALAPITHYLQIIRGIILKGNSIEYFWPHIGALCLFIAVVMTVSVCRFKKRLE
jgi:ABC-2 type transport system permease protein